MPRVNIFYSRDPRVVSLLAATLGIVLVGWSALRVARHIVAGAPISTMIGDFISAAFGLLALGVGALIYFLKVRPRV